MTPSKYIEHMDQLPPFVLCAIVKTLNGKPISLRQFQRMTGWSRNTVIACCKSTSWRSWTLEDMEKFFTSLNLTTRRINLIRIEVNAGRIDLSHIRNRLTKRTIANRLVTLFKALIKEKGKL